MSARTYDASGSNSGERTKRLNKANVFRDEQRFIELDASSDLSLKSVLKLLPPLRKKDRDWPCIVIIGDGATLDDDAYAKQQTFFQNGVLRAAYSLQAHVFDNGLGSSVAVGSTSAPNVTDFGRDIFHVGVMPCCDNPPSQFTTHQIVLNDFDGWEDRPDEFAQQKFSFLRRLNGKSCRTVCVVFNAGPSAFEEVAEACRLGMPVIVMKGSGELADELATAQEGSSGGDDQVLQAMVDSSCLYVFDADGGRACDLATLIRCHCLTDMITMTRMINDLDPVASTTISTPCFERGNPASQIRSRVGTNGKLKYIGKTRGNGLKKNRRYKVVSYQMTSNRVPTPPKGSISKGGIFKRKNPPPAGNIPPISQDEPVEDDAAEREKPSQKADAEPEAEPEAELDFDPDVKKEEDSSSTVDDKDNIAREAAAVKIQAAERRREAVKEVQKMREEKAKKDAEDGNTEGTDASADSDTKDESKNAESKDTSDGDAKAQEAAALKIQAAERRREAVKEVQKMREEKAKKDAADESGDVNAEDITT